MSFKPKAPDQLTADQLETYASTLDSNTWLAEACRQCASFSEHSPVRVESNCPKTVESLPNCLHYNLQDCTSVRGSKNRCFWASPRSGPPRSVLAQREMEKRRSPLV